MEPRQSSSLKEFFTLGRYYLVSVIEVKWLDCKLGNFLIQKVLTVCNQNHNLSAIVYLLLLFFTVILVAIQEIVRIGRKCKLQELVFFSLFLIRSKKNKSTK